MGEHGQPMYLAKEIFWSELQDRRRGGGQFEKAWEVNGMGMRVQCATWN